MAKKILFFTMFAFCAMYISAQNQNSVNGYLNSQVAVLNNIQPLTTKERQQFDSVFWAKFQEHGQMEIAFHEAMCATLTAEKHFKQYFKDQIEKRAWVILNDDFNYFRQKQKLPENSLEEIKPLLQQRSNETAYYEHRFFTNSKKRADAIAAIAFEYDSTQTVREIIMYQLTKEKIKYVYRENPEKLKELDDYLYKTSYPKALKHLRVEKRKKTGQDAEEKDLLIF